MHNHLVHRNRTVLATLVLACAGYGSLAAAIPAGAGAAGAPAPRSAAVATTHVVGTKARPAIENCGLAPAAVRPRDLTLSCADGGTEGVGLVWKSWVGTHAFASGVYTWNPCTPYCVASKKWGRTSATFTLDDPVQTKSGWLFERLVVRVNGKLPPHTARVLVFSEKPVTMVTD